MLLKRTTIRTKYGIYYGYRRYAVTDHLQEMSKIALIIISLYACLYFSMVSQ